MNVVRKEDYDDVLSYAPQWAIDKWDLTNPKIIKLTEGKPVQRLDRPKGELERMLFGWVPTDD